MKLCHMCRKMIPKILENLSAPDFFLYFAYGSNLLKKRIRINNPSAEFISTGRLDNHRLDFIRYSERWGGASATIVPTPNAHVWGSVWRLNKQDMRSLDQQEGVPEDIYFPKDVVIHTSPEEMQVTCRVYQMVANPPVRRDDDLIPEDRLPSLTYLQTIQKGAVECQLPEYYIEMLKAIPNNGNIASEALVRLLNEDVTEKSQAGFIKEEKLT